MLKWLTLCVAFLLSASVDALAQQSSFIQNPGPPQVVTLKQLGIYCDGTTDRSTAINAALVAHPGTWIDGQGAVCGMAQNGVIRINSYVANVTFKDINPTRSNARVLTTAGTVTTTGVRLSNVIIDRNGALSGGNTNNNAGIWAVNFSDWIVNDLEVTGNGKGFGLQLIPGTGVCQNAVFNRLHVHDISFSSATDPGIQSITMVHQSNCHHMQFRSSWIDTALATIGNLGDPTCYTQLTGTVPCGVPIPYQTNGFSTGAPSSDILFDGVYITNVGTGADHGGGGGAINDNIRWRNSYIYRVGDYGIAFKHCKTNVSALGVVVEQAGIAGFLANGPSDADACTPTNIEFGSDTARNIGAPYDYGSGTAQLWVSGYAGFSMPLAGATMPVNVSLHDDTIIDDQNTPTTVYGVTSDDKTEDNRVWNNTASGTTSGLYHNISNYTSVSSQDGLTFTGKTTFAVNGTVTMASDLNLTHRLGWDRSTLTLVNGDNADVAEPNTVRINIIGPTGAFSLSGMTAPTSGAGFHCFRNTVSQTFTILNNSSNSTAGNRILTRSGGDLTTSSSNPEVCMDYDGAASAWFIFTGPVSAGVVPFSSITTPATDTCPYYTSLTAADKFSCLSFGRSTLAAASAQAFNSTIGSWYVLAASAAGASHTGDTVETPLATIAIPAGAMGANGILRITTKWSYTNSVNSKILRIRLGGTGINGTTAWGPTLTTTASTVSSVLIQNRNSASSQLMATNDNTALGVGGFGSSTGALNTGAQNTASALNLYINGLLANTGETITLESYTVELYHGN